MANCKKCGKPVTVAPVYCPECQEKTSGWISVEDGLPDLIPCNAGTAYSEAVFVWTTGRKAMVAIFDGDGFRCAADYWEAWDEEVTHWMPCRPPGEEGEKEDDHDDG